MSTSQSLNYNRSIEKVLKKLNMNLSMNQNTLSLLNKLLNIVNNKLVNHCKSNLKSSKKSKVSIAYDAIQRIFPGELRNAATAEGHKSMILFYNGLLEYRVKTPTFEKGIFYTPISDMANVMIPEGKLDDEAIFVIDDFLNSICIEASEKASEYGTPKSEIDVSDMKTALTFVLPKGIQSHAFTEANRAVFDSKEADTFTPEEVDDATIKISKSKVKRKSGKKRAKRSLSRGSEAERKKKKLSPVRKQRMKKSATRRKKLKSSSLKRRKAKTPRTQKIADESKAEEKLHHEQTKESQPSSSERQKLKSSVKQKKKAKLDGTLKRKAKASKTQRKKAKLSDKSRKKEHSLVHRKKTKPSRTKRKAEKLSHEKKGKLSHKKKEKLSHRKKAKRAVTPTSSIKLVNYSDGIKSIAQDVNKNVSLKTPTLKFLVEIMNKLNEKLVDHCNQNTSENSTVDVKTAENAINSIFPGELLQHAIVESKKTIFMYEHGRILHQVPGTKSDHKQKILPVTFKPGVLSLTSSSIPGAQLSDGATSLIESFLQNVATKICEEVKSSSKNKGNLSYGEISSALERYFPKGIQQHALSEGAKAILSSEIGIFDYKPPVTQHETSKNT